MNALDPHRRSPPSSRSQDRVRVIDVSPRDGLQNEPGVIPAPEKLRLIELLAQAGVNEIEVTSFVSPKWIPQLGDATEVVAGLPELHARLTAMEPPHRFPPAIALLPNARGLQSLERAESLARGPAGASSAGSTAGTRPLIDKIAIFTAASETFSQRNTNASIDQTIDRFREITLQPRTATGLRGYLSCVIACPFEGPIAPARVADISQRLVDLGITELDLGDTIGAGTTESVTRMLEAVRKRLGEAWFDPARSAITLHFHDTFGRAADCVRTALDLGIRSFDGSVAGLGGCPYASTPGRRAPGNISTELLVRTIRAAGFRCDVDDIALEQAAAFARGIVAQARALA